jgi:hypothetical protein
LGAMDLCVALPAEKVSVVSPSPNRENVPLAGPEVEFVGVHREPRIATYGTWSR